MSSLHLCLKIWRVANSPSLSSTPHITPSLFQEQTPLYHGNQFPKIGSFSLLIQNFHTTTRFS